jgi:hypothetical protein
MANSKDKEHPKPKAVPSVIQITFTTPPDAIAYNPNPAQAFWGQPIEWHCADPFSVHFDLTGTPFDTDWSGPQN